MNRLQFSITINASKEKTWETMLGDHTYRQWTDVFSPGSHYVGNWEKGSEILFLGPENEGKMSGMVSYIKDSRLYEYISIEHRGVVHNGIKDTTSDAVKDWVGALENYTFKDLGGKTEVLVEIDIGEKYAKMFEGLWPKALQKLKTLTETQ